jgi:hypothetical protein
VRSEVDGEVAEDGAVMSKVKIYKNFRTGNQITLFNAETHDMHRGIRVAKFLGDIRADLIQIAQCFRGIQQLILFCVLIAK